MNQHLSKSNLASKVCLSTLLYFLFIGSAVGFTYTIVQGQYICGSKTLSGAVLIAFICLSIMAIVMLQGSTTEYLSRCNIEDVQIVYHDSEIEPLQYIDGKSDWIDLRCAKDYDIKKGDFTLVDLGISVKLPKGYEMIVAPRSSTFKNTGLIQTNSIGVIDESYSSDDDVIMWPCYATKDISIKKNERLCQFRIVEHQPKINFVKMTSLGNNVRGGFGSTGRS